MDQSPNPVRAYRLAQKPPLKLKELAKRIGTSSANLSRIENGQTISEALLPKLQAETDIPVAKLRPDLAQLFRTETEAA